MLHTKTGIQDILESKLSVALYRWHLFLHRFIFRPKLVLILRVKYRDKILHLNLRST